MLSMTRDPQWITNNPDTAEQLRLIDEAYQVARLMAFHLPLAEKIIAFRNAKITRDAAYAAIAVD